MTDLTRKKKKGRPPEDDRDNSSECAEEALEVKETRKTLLPWQQMASEPNFAYLAFVVFRDNSVLLSPSKPYSIRSLYKLIYPNAINAPSQWSAWATEYDWAERVRLYRAHLETVQVGAIEIRAEELAKEIAFFRDTAIESGSRLAQICLKCIDLLEKFMDGDVEVKSIRDAAAIASIVKSLQQGGFEVWAEGLGLESLARKAQGKEG